MDQLTGSKLRKEYKAVYCHSVYLTDHIYAEHIMQNARLDELQAGIKTAERNINNLRYADDTISNGRKLRVTKEPHDDGKKRRVKKLP